MMLFEHDGPFFILWGLVGFVISLLVVGLVVWLVVALLRGSEGRGNARPTPALGVLEERYARGEISRDEFLERRAVLQGEEPAGGA